MHCRNPDCNKGSKGRRRSGLYKFVRVNPNGSFHCLGCNKLFPAPPNITRFRHHIEGGYLKQNAKMKRVKVCPRITQSVVERVNQISRANTVARGNYFSSHFIFIRMKTKFKLLVIDYALYSIGVIHISDANSPPPAIPPTHNTIMATPTDTLKIASESVGSNTFKSFLASMQFNLLLKSCPNIFY